MYKYQKCILEEVHLTLILENKSNNRCNHFYLVYIKF